MSYLYGIKFKMQENDLIRALREASIVNARSYIPFTDISASRNYTQLTITRSTGPHNAIMYARQTCIHLIPLFWMS